MSEVDQLAKEVGELDERVRQLQLTVEGMAVLEPRIEALERSNVALQQRVDHMSKVILDIQRSVQSLGKQMTHMQSEHTLKLDLIMSKQNELLSLLQPRATIPG